ncbi:peptidase S10, serine carboxypeptidase, alpha/beta hydrolase fold protein [Tanacetum coccineum]
MTRTLLVSTKDTTFYGSGVDVDMAYPRHGYAISSLMDTAYWLPEYLSSKYLRLSSRMDDEFCEDDGIILDDPSIDGGDYRLIVSYVGVGEHEDVEFFYYFAESQRNPLEDPLLLYLSGGPSVSGFSSFLYQIGPLRECLGVRLEMDYLIISFSKRNNLFHSVWQPQSEN